MAPNQSRKSKRVKAVAVVPVESNSIPIERAYHIPLEIILAILSFFNFDYSFDGNLAGRVERNANLRSFSRISAQWRAPMQEKLFQSWRITNFAKLDAKAGIVFGGIVREVRVKYPSELLSWNASEAQKVSAASKFVTFLGRLHNITSLALINPPFDTLGARASAKLRATRTLPKLTAIEIVLDDEADVEAPEFIPTLQDLVATSSGKIERLKFIGGTFTVKAHPASLGLDFGGALRYLRLDTYATQLLIRLNLDSMEIYRGLKEVDLSGRDFFQRDWSWAGRGRDLPVFWIREFDRVTKPTITDSTYRTRGV